MPSIGTLGGTLPWGPKSLKVKRQAFPDDGSTRQKRPIPASSPFTENHHGTGAKGATGCGSMSEDLLVDTDQCVNYSVLTSYSGAFSCQTCTILDAIGKTVTKRFI